MAPKKASARPGTGGVSAEKGVTISKIYSYLVTPGKANQGPVEIPAGTEIPLKGRMYEMLRDIFKNAERECTIPISFTMDVDGKQKNAVRDKLLAFLKSPSIKNGQALATGLQEVTTARSGLGLLFLTLGRNDANQTKIVISRFPADQGVLAERTGRGLAVSFVEKIFMKSAHAYKAVLYQGGGYDHDFWDGAAIDRQINVGNLADYWIRDFLHSDFKITGKTGTKQFALALRAASATITDEKDKAQLISATQLLPNLKGQSISVNEFIKKYSLPKPIHDALVKHLPNEEMATATFRFDPEEFSKHVKYTSKELDSGAILTAPSGKFDDCFTTKKVGDTDGQLEFTTRGRVVNERLKSRKL